MNIFTEKILGFSIYTLEILCLHKFESHNPKREYWLDFKNNAKFYENKS